MQIADKKLLSQATCGVILLATLLLVGLACGQQPSAIADTTLVDEVTLEQPTETPAGESYLPIVQATLEIPIELAQLSIFYPREVEANPNNNLVYVVSGFGGNSVFILDGLEVISEYIIGGPSINNIEVDVKNNHVHVLHEDERLEILTVFQNRELLYSIEIPFTGVRDSLWNSQEELLYVAGSYRINEPTVTITRSIAIYDGQEEIASLDTGNFQPLHLAFDPTMEHVYVGGAYYEVVDGRTHTTAGMLVFDQQTLIAEHRIGSSRVNGLIAHPNGDVFVYTSPNSSDFNDLHLFRNGELITSTLIHDRPYLTMGMVSNPTTGDVYLYNAGEVSRVRVEGDSFVNLGIWARRPLAAV